MIGHGQIKRCLTRMVRATLLASALVFLNLPPAGAQTKEIQEVVEAKLKAQRVENDQITRLMAELERKRVELGKLEAELGELKKSMVKVQFHPEVQVVSQPKPVEPAKATTAKVEAKSVAFSPDGLTITVDGQTLKLNSGGIRINAAAQETPKKDATITGSVQIIHDEKGDGKNPQTLSFQLQDMQIQLDGKKPAEVVKAVQKPHEILLREVDGKWIVVNKPDATPGAKIDSNLGFWFTSPEVKDSKGGLQFKIVTNDDPKANKTPDPAQGTKAIIGWQLAQPKDAPKPVPPKPPVPVAGPVKPATPAADGRLEKLEKRLQELEQMLKKLKEKD